MLIKTLATLAFFILSTFSASAQKGNDGYRVLAFFTGKNDMGHISFVHEANRWFSALSQKYDFTYDSTCNWDNLNEEYLSGYKVVIFLDTRPEAVSQRNAFKHFMETGGSFIGFHFSAFSLTPSAFPQNWDWYHNEFLGAGEYKGNTWRPVPAILRVEDRQHPATKNLPEIFKSAPNEWYSWQNDLKQNNSIKILLSIDPASFPLGTGPKLHEIWQKGYYPVVWTNTNYRMLYINMGHNDIDYENKTNRELSHTFTNETQNKLITDGLIWLLKGK